MSNAFEAARAIGTNLGGIGQEIRDTKTIDSILSNLSQEKNPEVIQDSIGKILSQVSPERQGQAIQFLQNRYNQIKSNQEMQKQESSLRSEGVNPNLPPNLQVEQYKNRLKQQRLSQFGLGGQQNFQMPENPFASQMGGVPQQPQQQPPQQQPKSRTFQDLSDDELILATGAPDKEISEPAKAELNKREKNKKFDVEVYKINKPLMDQLIKENEGYQERKRIFDRMEEIDSNPEETLTTPMLASMLDKIGLPLGILDNPDSEEYDKLSNNLIRGIKDVFGARINVIDVESFLKTIPSLKNTREGRKRIIKGLRELDNAKNAKYLAYRDIIDERESQGLTSVPLNLSQQIDKRSQEIIKDSAQNFEKQNKRVKIKLSDGRIGTIPLESLNPDEKNRGYEVVNE